LAWRAEKGQVRKRFQAIFKLLPAIRLDQKNPLPAGARHPLSGRLPKKARPGGARQPRPLLLNNSRLPSAELCNAQCATPHCITE
jgi:hypothetical protein